ncbi:MAG: zinc-dependent metalloprotease [Xanthomonadales bacterium]|nr:zinc-dependent metalloprotease [Xanthomonadales bacterium]
MPAYFQRILLTLLVVLFPIDPAMGDDTPSISDRIDGLAAMEGFFDLYWDNKTGQLLLRIDAFEEAFLYQGSMPRGVGSNDLLLDRGQLGATQVVRFFRSGPRVLLIADNLDYRSSSDDASERAAVEHSFAESVLWGFPVEAVGENSDVLVDATAFALRDAHGLSARLDSAGEGKYSPDESRSAVFLPNTRSFPDNTEIEAIVTLTGLPERGAVLPTVAPDATAVTVHLRHSLVRLPPDGFKPVPFDPRSGYFPYPRDSGFIDYSSPIGEPMRHAFAPAHRLKKKDPSAKRSEPVEPIIYYVDSGAPEPVRSALIEGAQWWNEAFEAAGYERAFRVELMPEGADPMDVRYNVIQWVHRSTRGWSYGGSVIDPRTGEIIKGHVTLGSLRVRQDYLIAEGLLSPYDGASYPSDMLDMSLARIRQLSAHEVGHTLGLAHNFAASADGRASVMDYPFPLIRFDDNGELDLSEAYGVGIGAWDRRAIAYAYQDFPEGTDTHAARAAILAETLASGLRFVDDADARDAGTAHPAGNLWDNGEDPITELAHLVAVRAHALNRFSPATIRHGRPEAMLEEVLVPIYLLHRFQIQAVGKLVGGQQFTYTLRGDGQTPPSPVEPSRQAQALDALLNTLSPEFLELPAGLAQQIPPRPPGHPDHRELFRRATGSVFDPLAPAAASASLTLDVLFDQRRLARLHRQQLLDPVQPGPDHVLGEIVGYTWHRERQEGVQGAIQREVARQVLDRLFRLAASSEVEPSLRAAGLDALSGLRTHLDQVRGRPDTAWSRFYALARFDLDRYFREPGWVPAGAKPTPPPGSPIGSG